ncbi:unnamed protein product [Oppiella nova]|uniref:Uncharacterized protein n=1 Tax=Oppiella nova TaxID=334625 RepID=A0A7R9QPW0_9ACAR|nr:unnamed protein product [Oppiella nova]CAG2169992.1 unnamed protein product [Oppiella nova]
MKHNRRINNILIGDTLGFFHFGCDSDHLGQQLQSVWPATTPFLNTNATVYHRMVCTGGPVQQLLLNATFETAFSCNGYDTWVAPATYMATVNGWTQEMDIANISQYYSYLNGNMYEYNFGQITAGPCTGDTFFSVNAYVADDQLGCSGNGLRSVSVDYTNAQISGQKCNQKCTVDKRYHSYFSFNPAIKN